jgi:replicative DNA helicase
MIMKRPEIPHSTEAEQGVLGCILLSPREVIGEVVQAHSGEAFYDLRHRTIFDLLVEMFDKQEPIDMITVYQKLKDRNQIEAVGGMPYLTSLPDGVPSAANIDYYLSILREKFLIRKMILVSEDIAKRGYEQADKDANKFIDAAESDILAVAHARAADNKQLTIKDLVRKAIKNIEDYSQLQGKLIGLATGYPDFDRMTCGLRGGEMIVIAARPSVGKTSLAMNIAEHVAVDQQLPVGVFSLEMTAESLVERMICSRAKVSVQGGRLTESDFPKISSASGKLALSKLHIDDTPALSILQLRAKARRMWQQFGIKLFIVDYLQLLHARGETRQQEITTISGGLKALAKELNVPVIVLSQLNREVEREKGRKPRLADLRESGAIEQDADLAGLLYKADPEDRKKAAKEEDDDAMAREVIPVNLLIAKQRNGPTGDVYLTFLKSITRFESSARTQL